MTTLADQVRDARNLFMTGSRDVMNELDADINGTVSTITMRRALNTISEGVVLSIGLEQMYVWSISGQNVEVHRGYGGSLAVAHTAGDLVYVNAEVSDFEISRAINDVLRDLSSPDKGLFRVKSKEFTYNPSIQGYDLDVADDILSIWRVRYQTSGPEKDWPVVPEEYYRLDEAANTTDFASGKQLVVETPGESGRPIRVSYRTGYAMLSTLTDDVLAVSGLHSEAHDIPPLGAAIRLTAGRDVKRTFMDAQPEPRRAEEVPAGSGSQAMRPLIAVFQERVSAERARCWARWM